MIARGGSGWQTVLADLSMILFMVTAAAAGEAPGAPPIAPAPRLPALGEPVAVWSSGESGPGLNVWLDEQGDDTRTRLTIIGTQATSAAALDLAKGAARPARVIIEPVGDEPLAAFLTYDLQQPPVPEGATR